MDYMLTCSGHPRLRGREPLDITCYLESQRDWDLERDNGWTGVELLYTFDFENSDYQPPQYEVNWMYDEGRVVLDLNGHPVKDFRDIPLTLSSEVEGALMQAIRDLDPRIKFPDLLARLSVLLSRILDQELLTGNSPEYFRGGAPATTGTLCERTNRFRQRNCVPARTQNRKGAPDRTQYIWSQLSEAGRAQNSTRELQKLSSARARHRKKGNKGRFKANAGGWGKGLRPSNPSPRRRPTTKRKPRPAKSHTNKRRQLTPKVIAPRTLKVIAPRPIELQPSSSVSDHLNPGFEMSSSAPTAATNWTYPIEPILTTDTPSIDLWGGSSSPAFQPAAFDSLENPFVQPKPNLDWRWLPPQTFEDIRDIDSAVNVTRDSYYLRTGLYPMPTRSHDCYIEQVIMILDDFHVLWSSRFSGVPVPGLVWCQARWSDGFKSEKVFSSGDEQVGLSAVLAPLAIEDEYAWMGGPT